MGKDRGIIYAREIFNTFQGYYELELKKLEDVEEYSFEKLPLSLGPPSLIGSMFGIDMDSMMELEEIVEFYIKYGSEMSLMREWGSRNLLDYGKPGVVSRLKASADMIIEARKEADVIGYIVGQKEDDTINMMWPCIIESEGGKDLSIYLILSLIKVAEEEGFKKAQILVEKLEMDESVLTKKDKRYNKWRAVYLKNLCEKRFDLKKQKKDGWTYYEFVFRDIGDNTQKLKKIIEKKQRRQKKEVKKRGKRQKKGQQKIDEY
tara:strand:- start:4740 stop:5525 length:786 start_codon:yes stop_codon:yes gene_type:complete